MLGSIQVEAKGDLLIVSEPASNFVAIYVKSSERSQLMLMRRTPTTDNVLLAEAFQAAVGKARELGGLRRSKWAFSRARRVIELGCSVLYADFATKAHPRCSNGRKIRSVPGGSC